MAISRKPCNGRHPDGKRCRKWKDLNSEGLCPTCSNGGGDANIQEDRCGMCPSSSSAAVNDSTTKTGIMIQCNWCDGWFHDQCIGSSSFQSYIGQEPPPDEGNHNNGSKALHLWFCAGCASQQKNIFDDIIDFLKKNSNVGEVAGRRLVDGERAQSSPPTSLTPGETAPKTVAMTVDNSYQTVPTIPRNPEVLTQNTRVCGFYRRGICRHGQSGKNRWEDRIQCIYRHPKKCYKYCKYGSDPVMGCNKEYCKLMHPLLCSHSVEEGSCPYLDCKYEHLVGTTRATRYRSTNFSNIRSFPSTSHYRSSNQVQQRNYPHTNQNISLNDQQNKHQSYHYNKGDFPQLPQRDNLVHHPFTNIQQSDSFSPMDIMLTLKNIQAELSLIKQGHYSKNLDHTKNITTAAYYPAENQREAHNFAQQEEVSKNYINPPNPFNG